MAVPINIMVDIVNDQQVGNIRISSGFESWFDIVDLLNRAQGIALREAQKQRQQRLIKPTGEDIMRLKS